MTEKTMPEWGDVVHVNGAKYIVACSGFPHNYLRNEYDESLVASTNEIDEYKPATIKIGNVEVLEPVREPLIYGDKYWVIDTANHQTNLEQWEDSYIDHCRLKAGFIQKTGGAARKHLEALVLASGGEVQ